MTASLFPYAYLRDPRLAGHATSASAAWLWQPDGERMLWANGAAAALEDAPSAAALTNRACADEHPLRKQIASLANTLPANGSPRLIMLENGKSRPLAALCSRIQLEGEMPVVLALTTDAAGLHLSLEERIQRLLGDSGAPLAAFSPDGDLIHATAAAADRIGQKTTLAALGAGGLIAKALGKGRAAGPSSVGKMRLDRVGRDAATVLIASFPAAAAERPQQPTELAPTIPAIEATTAEAGVTPTAAPQASDNEPVQIPAEPPTPAEPKLPEPTSVDEAAPTAERQQRPSLRFVWHMEQDGRFSIKSEAFLALVGAATTSLLGRPWNDIAAALKLDPGDQIAGAIEARETWSGIGVQWPLEDHEKRIHVELSGLPVFDRERNFRGYRGFGVCRNYDRLLAQKRQQNADGCAEARTPSLSPVERSAFRELARELSARLKGDQSLTSHATGQPEAPAEDVQVEDAVSEPANVTPEHGVLAVLELLPVGVLIYRGDTPLYANRAFFAWSGDADLAAFATGGGVDRLFVESGLVATGDESQGTPLAAGEKRGPAESRLFAVDWQGERAHALMVTPVSVQTDHQAERQRARALIRELRAALKAATDGLVYLNASGRIVRLSQGAEKLFERESKSVAGKSFVALLAAESRNAASADFEALVANAEATHQPREVEGRRRNGESFALTITLCRLEDEGQPYYCAVFRDISRYKLAEQALSDARHQAEQALQAKSAFLAKVSHDIRTPLNAIIGFTEVMMEEQLGPIENDRYHAYLRDIHSSGEHVVGMLNDLLDLSKVEAGNFELKFDNVDLNAVTQECVALMQPHANRGRIIVRTSLASGLSPIVADAQSVRQILLNLIANSIKFTGAGGQVIVSTAASNDGEAVLRVRDTGAGMSEEEITSALAPFRQIETSAYGGSGNADFGLPLTKALAEANRANFAVKSGMTTGTLVEVVFPTARTADG